MSVAVVMIVKASLMRKDSGGGSCGGIDEGVDSRLAH